MVTVFSSDPQCSYLNFTLGDITLDECEEAQAAQAVTPKSRRGRKRKIVDENADENAIENELLKTVVCGKCDQAFKNKFGFLQHAAALHGGLVIIF